MSKQILFTFCYLFLQIFAFGQSKILIKADNLYKAKSYTEAAKLYEIALKEKSSLSVKTKLANCYRVNNRMEIAEKLYAEITTEEKAKAKTFFYYGETLMSNGKYDEAKKWLSKYEKEKPDDEQARLMIEACDYVKNIQPYFPYVKTEAFAHNSDADDSTPVMWGDKLVFSSDRSQGKSKKSGWTGRSFIKLFYSTQTDTAFSKPKVFSGKLVASNKNIGNPSFVDSTRIFFTKNGVELSKKNIYNLSLYTAENAGGNRWKNIKILPFSSKEYNFMHPAVSADGQYLYFVSDKGGGEGGTDIWVSKRTKDGWSRTKNLGFNVNTAANEGYPFIDKNGKLYFCSKGHSGYGGFDIFMTEQDATGEWKKPINLGSPINSPRDDISIFIDEKTKKGMFTSNRSGGDDDIYLFEILEEAYVEEKEPMTVPVVIKTEITAKKEGKIEGKEELIIIAKEEKSKKEKVKKEKKKVKKKKEKATIKVESEEEKEEELLTEDNAPNEQQAVIPETPVAINNSAEEKKVKKGMLTNFYYLSELAKMVDDNLVETQQIYRLKDIKYDFEVYEVTPEVAKKLNIIADFLNTNEDVKVEIGAHTESKGNDKNNLILSRYRAQAAVAYLKKQGIDKSRLTYKGYGEQEILNDCVNDADCSEKDHAYNQRLEMKILKN